MEDADKRKKREADTAALAEVLRPLSVEQRCAYINVALEELGSDFRYRLLDDGSGVEAYDLPRLLS